MARPLAEFWKIVTANGYARCFVAEHDDDAGRCDGPVDAHHLVRAQVIRRELGAASPALSDPRIGVPVCRKHHGEITVAARRVAFADLPEPALGWADEYEMLFYLERECV